MRKRITAGLLAVVFCIIAILPAGCSAQKGPSMVSRGFERAVIDGRQATRFVDSALAAESETSGYLFSYYCVDSSRIVQYDSRNVSDARLLLSLSRGQTKSAPHEVTTTGTIVFSGEPDEKMKDAVSAWAGADGSYAVRSLMGRGTFSFPQDERSDRVSYFIGVGFDEYAFRLQRYDVYQPRQGAVGLAAEPEYRQAGTVTVHAHIPKQVVYCTAGKTANA